MVFRPLITSDGSRMLCSGIFVALFATVISCSSVVAPADAQADEAKQAVAAKGDETDPAYSVPDGKPQEILDFITKLEQRRAKFASRQEQVEHLIKVHRANISAGSKILKQEPDDELAEKAVGMKLKSLLVLSANQIPGAAQEALDAVVAMKQDGNKIVAAAATEQWLTVQILNAVNLNVADRNSLAEEVLTDADKKKFSRAVLPGVMQLGQAFEQSSDSKSAAAYYAKVADLAEHHATPQLKDLAERVRGMSRRVDLPGNEIQIEAKLLDGTPFDWASYRGKVVLVDFWATWCGPCVAELPNVKMNYEKYHDKGFDVVGISLDRGKEPLEKFIAKEELPWAQLYDAEAQEGTGWNHPVAQYYGISAIPTVILVGKDGKVISLDARGPELGKHLEKLLGKAE